MEIKIPYIETPLSLGITESDKVVAKIITYESGRDIPYASHSSHPDFSDSGDDPILEYIVEVNGTEVPSDNNIYQDDDLYNYLLDTIEDVTPVKYNWHKDDFEFRLRNDL